MWAADVFACAGVVQLPAAGADAALGRGEGGGPARLQHLQQGGLPLPGGADHQHLQQSEVLRLSKLSPEEGQDRDGTLWNTEQEPDDSTDPFSCLQGGDQPREQPLSPQGVQVTSPEGPQPHQQEQHLLDRPTPEDLLKVLVWRDAPPGLSGGASHY